MSYEEKIRVLEEKIQEACGIIKILMDEVDYHEAYSEDADVVEAMEEGAEFIRMYAR